MSSKGKKKAIILITSYLMITILDILFTYLATPDLLLEANPIASSFLRGGVGWGWVSLILANLFTTAAYGALTWYSFAIYKSVSYGADGFIDFLRKIDLKRKGSSLLASIGYGASLSMLIGRLLPVIDWGIYLAGYRIVWYDKLKRAIPGNRPDLWVAGILALVFCAYWFIKEYRENQKQYHTYQYF